MNCQTHLYRGQAPKLVTRRWFLRDCAMRFEDDGWCGCMRFRWAR